MLFNYYKIVNLTNNKIYIGITEKTCEERWKKHISLLNKNNHPNWLLQEDWNKFGKENFQFAKIDTFEGELEEGYAHEYELIQSFSGEKYNLAPGGQVNPMYSQIIREKMIKTKQEQVPNIYQLEEVEENIFKIVNIYSSQKEAGRESCADQGNIQHAISKHTKGCGYYWVTEEMIATFEKEWRPQRTKITPCAELSANGEIVEVHHNRSIFEKKYGLTAGCIKGAIKRNGKTGGRKFINITEEEYYSIRPITLIK